MTPSRLPIAAFFVTAICGPPQPTAPVTAEELHDCDGPPFTPYEGPDRVRLVLRVTDRTEPVITPVNACVRVDGGALRAELETAADLRKGIDYATWVSPHPRVHTVSLSVKAMGTGSLFGHRFQINSAHCVEGTNVIALEAALDDKRSPDASVEKRLVIEWTGNEEGKCAFSRDGDAGPIP